MQLREKSALEKLLHQMPLMLLDIIFQLGLNLRICLATQSQDDRLLFTYYFRMGSLMHRLDENHIVFLFYHPSLTQPKLDLPEEDDADKLRYCFIIVDYLVNRIVLRLQIVEYYIFDHIRQPPEDSNLLQIERYKVFLIRSPRLLLADLGDRHHLGFVVLVHEVDEPLLLDEPLGELAILLLANVERLRVGIPMTMLLRMPLILQRQRLQLTLIAFLQLQIQHTQEI
jgi:hypothetical protein